MAEQDLITDKFPRVFFFYFTNWINGEYFILLYFSDVYRSVNYIAVNSLCKQPNVAYTLTNIRKMKFIP